MMLDVSETGMLSTRSILPLSERHQVLICGEALKQSANVNQALMWLPSNVSLMSYGYEVIYIRCPFPLTLVLLVSFPHTSFPHSPHYFPPFPFY